MRVYASTKCDVYDILLLELVPGGDLSSHLTSEEKRKKLSSMTRVNILCEIAGAIHFLHHGGVFDDVTEEKYKIFHRDIKSSNICLDSKYHAKLIDCGLAKFDVALGGRIDQHVSLAETLIRHTSHYVMGTSGYICPHYAKGFIDEYRAECDVYSFGVVMLELITGTLQNSKGDLPLMFTTAKSLIQRVDPLAGSGWNHVLNPLAELALECVKYNIDERPDFGMISRRLDEIRQPSPVTFWSQMYFCSSFYN